MESFEEDLAYLGWPADATHRYSEWGVATEWYLAYMHREQSGGGAMRGRFGAPLQALFLPRAGGSQALSGGGAG